MFMHKCITFTRIDRATTQVLESDERSVLLDIRPKSVVKEEGSPEVKVAKKRSLALPYTTVSRGFTPCCN